MNHQVVKDLFSQINVWKRGGERAPHKPLLLLYALAKCSRGAPREIPYIEIERDIRNLLVEFGPSRKSYHPEYPFWRLQNDGLWELQRAENLERRQGHTDAKKSELIKYNVIGGFKEEIYAALHNNPKLILSIAQDILEQNFPDSIHEDILSAVGLESKIYEIQIKKRDANFRKRILVAYQYQCSICGFSVRLGDTLLGIEAAHIKWHQAGGPDIEANGLALCSIHHKMFDRGAFTLSEKLIIEVSEQVNGAQGSKEWIFSFHGKPISLPQNPNNRPDIPFLHWHRKEVFRGPSRYI